MSDKKDGQNACKENKMDEDIADQERRVFLPENKQMAFG
ncbi:hypothetical protein FOYG_15086 [Fusarium oxysporum NRRL 32931]|uniref:Uncharacterized protein n=1 Tax=Fusarium oxysporum NRRL 32931 TaxID=660029 RepID=W9HPX3_FUSOX|nr:hypothetical protein FOYG_15086 [Fusarium oxysporum NRRL 32931]